MAVLFWYFLGVNLLTYVLFFWDKLMAMRGGWRVPEKTLLMWAFLGGSPLAKVAQRLMRHKTRKEPFRSHLNRIILVQCILAVLLSIPDVRHVILAELSQVLDLS